MNVMKTKLIGRPGGVIQSLRLFDGYHSTL